MENVTHTQHGSRQGSIVKIPGRVVDIRSAHSNTSARKAIFIEYADESGVDPMKDDDMSDKTESDASSFEDLEVRENWTGRLDFLLSCIGFAVGLGNIWRFPYLCYTSGGGAFLIPYTFFLVTCGLPLFFMEVSYGQFASLSPITVWRISPLFKGIGYGMVIISGIVCVYYNIILTWNFYFLFKSMSKVLPWSLCGQSWNSDLCVESGSSQNRTRYVNVTENGTFYRQLVTEEFTSSSEEFWKENVLEMSSGIEDLGQIRWPLFGCLVLAWVIVFLCLFKGVKSSGKVVYVTATFPYAVLIILLIRGLTLPGAMNGIKFYLVPKWEKIATVKVWGDAAVQIFYSVGMAWGSLITMSSYNKFSNNVYRDSMIVPLVNCGTSVFAGFVIFSVLGFMSYTTGLPIEYVVRSGPGLTFVAYPEAVANMPFSQLWAILFFLMIFTVGLDSQFGMFETMTSAFIDEYPHQLRKYKTSFTAIMCLVEFVLGIPITFQGGIYILQIMDWYCATFSLMLLSVTECLIISWIYGIDRFARDIELMTGKKPCIFWTVMWRFITPIIVLFIWVFSVTQLEPVTLGDYKYPSWAITTGWLIGTISLVPLPYFALRAIYKESDGTVWQRIKKLSQPAASWGPSLANDRQRYLQSMNTYEMERYQAAQLGLDRGRYLQRMKGTPGDQNASYGGPAATLYLEPLDDHAAEAEAHEGMLPGYPSNSPYIFPKEPTQLTNLLNREKHQNSVC